MDLDDNLKKLDLILQNQKVLYNQNNELIYADIFHDTIKGSTWLPSDLSLSPGNMAFGYPALYVLYRVLDEYKPDNILEMGLGQSTKVIASYCKHFSSSKHQVVEHDRTWIDFFSNHFELTPKTIIHELPIKDISIDADGGTSNVTAYIGFSERFSDQKFNFICIDGPFGYRSPHYARVDILGILPECLKDSFVLLLDDCDREGELNTFNLISRTLTEHGIRHSSNIYSGTKDTGIIVSDDLSFLCTV